MKGWGKMKILYVSFIKPSEKFGGGLSALQMLSTLSQFAEVDYVGLAFNSEEFEKYNIHLQDTYLVKSGSKIKQVMNFLLKGYSSVYFNNWKKVSAALDFKKYNLVFMDFSRYGFVAEWAWKKKIPLIVRAHNVEADYTSVLYANNRNIKNYIRMLMMKYNEKKCVKYARRVVVLTQYEKERFQNLYDGKASKYPVLPQCVRQFDEKDYCNGKPYILLTGSLWFGPNADGILWFLKEVWSKLDCTVGEKYDLIIAGASPNSEIINLVNTFYNAKIFQNPERIGGFYKGASIYAAPIFYGAGMKVKVAEALSCGLSVVATDHALSGYEAAEHYTYAANTAEDFVNVISMLVKRNKEEIEYTKKKILAVFEQEYSLGHSEFLLKKIISDLQEDK